MDKIIPKNNVFRCKNCGKTRIYGHAADSYWTKFCSPRCDSKYRQKTQKREKEKRLLKARMRLSEKTQISLGKKLFDMVLKENPELAKRIKDTKISTTRTQQFRFDIMREKGFVCENCGATDNLQLHHKSYDWTLRYRKSKHFERKVIDFRPNLPKFRVLCKACHFAEHKKSL